MTEGRDYGKSLLFSRPPDPLPVYRAVSLATNITFIYNISTSIFRALRPLIFYNALIHGLYIFTRLPRTVLFLLLFNENQIRKFPLTIITINSLFVSYDDIVTCYTVYIKPDFEVTIVSTLAGSTNHFNVCCLSCK